MDGKSDGTMALKENVSESVSVNETHSSGSVNNVKKNLRSDSGISLENIDNQENLNKYMECEKKMDDEILCNLLKNVQTSSPSSGLGSDDEYAEDSKVDFKSLIMALSSCDVGKSKKDECKPEEKEKKKENKPIKEKKSNNGSEISDIKEIFNTNKNDKKVKSSNAYKMENKSEKSKDKANKILANAEKLGSAAIMEQLSAKISSLNLSKQHKSSKVRSKELDKKKNSEEPVESKSVSKKSETSVNCNDKNHVQIVPRDTQNKKDKKYTILLERGPWTKPKQYGVRNANPFYQGNHQLINTKILSGGKFWTAEEPVELLPKTIPDFEGLLSKPLADVPKVTDVNNCVVPDTLSVEGSILEDALSPAVIAAVLEKEVLSLANGIDKPINTSMELPNWGEYEMVKNILEREAGSIDVHHHRGVLVPPEIIVNEYADAAVPYGQTSDHIINEDLNDVTLITSVDQFLVQSPNSGTLHEMSYGCQRIDQLTPTSQTAAFGFDTIVSNEINQLPQNIELPSTPTNAMSPIQLNCATDTSLSLKIPSSSSSFYSPSPSAYSVSTGSPEQIFLSESPRYSKTPSHEQEYFGINNTLMNKSYCLTSSNDSLLTQMLSPNDSLLQGSTRSTSNRSSFCGSDYVSEHCFNSPNAERIENQNYDMYEMASPLEHRATRESFSSSSPLESPEIYLDPEELETFTNALNHIEQGNTTPEYLFGNQDNSNDIYLQLRSSQHMTDLQLTQSSIQDLQTQIIIANKQVLANNNMQNNTINNNTISQQVFTSIPYPQKDDNKHQKPIKCAKVKPIPIAAKQSYPCCTKMKKNAREILGEMFQRLDDNMQSNVMLKVHTLNDVSLMKLLDSLLAGWGCTKLPIPRLPLLYAICERMLMTKTTMGKFFKTYGNGHTVLDRALLTCPQSPILSRYIAECSMKAMENLPKDREFILDKSDSNGNTILHRAVRAGVECTAPLANLLQLNTDGSLFDVNGLNAEGHTPLHLACSIHVQQPGGLICSCLIMTHVFLEHGKSNPNIKDRKSGITALHTAVDSNGCSLALVSLLLKYGADPSIRNYCSSTPLDLAKSACRSSNNPQYAKQVVDILKKLKKPY